MGSAVGKHQSKRLSKSKQIVSCDAPSQKKVNFGDGDANENKVSKQDDFKVNNVAGCFGFLPDRRIIISRKRNPSELCDDNDTTIQYVPKSILSKGKGRSITNSETLPEIKPPSHSNGSRRSLPYPRPKRVAGNLPRSNLTPSKSNTHSNTTILPPIHRSTTIGSIVSQQEHGITPDMIQTISLQQPLTSASASQIDSITKELSNNNIRGSSEAINTFYQPVTPIIRVACCVSPIEVSCDNEDAKAIPTSSPQPHIGYNDAQELETNVSNISKNKDEKCKPLIKSDLSHDASIDFKDDVDVDTLTTEPTTDESTTIVHVKECVESNDAGSSVANAPTDNDEASCDTRAPVENSESVTEGSPAKTATSGLVSNAFSSKPPLTPRSVSLLKRTGNPSKSSVKSDACSSLTEKDNDKSDPTILPENVQKDNTEMPPCAAIPDSAKDSQDLTRDGTAEHIPPALPVRLAPLELAVKHVDSVHVPTSDKTFPDISEPEEDSPTCDGHDAHLKESNSREKNISTIEPLVKNKAKNDKEEVPKEQSTSDRCGRRSKSADRESRAPSACADEENNTHGECSRSERRVKSAGYSRHPCPSPLLRPMSRQDLKQLAMEEGLNPKASDSGLSFVIPAGDGLKPQVPDVNIASRITKPRRCPLTYEERMLMANINRQVHLSKRKEFALKDLRNVKEVLSATPSSSDLSRSHNAVRSKGNSTYNTDDDDQDDLDAEFGL